MSKPFEFEEIPLVSIKSEYYGIKVEHAEFDNVIIEQGKNRIECDGNVLIRMVQAAMAADLIINPERL